MPLRVSNMVALAPQLSALGVPRRRPGRDARLDKGRWPAVEASRRSRAVVRPAEGRAFLNGTSWLVDSPVGPRKYWEHCRLTTAGRSTWSSASPRSAARAMRCQRSRSRLLSSGIVAPAATPPSQRRRRRRRPGNRERVRQTMPLAHAAAEARRPTHPILSGPHGKSPASRSQERACGIDEEQIIALYLGPMRACDAFVRLRPRRYGWPANSAQIHRR